MLKINKKCDLYTYYFICQHLWWGLYVDHCPVIPGNIRKLFPYNIEGQSSAESITCRVEEAVLIILIAVRNRG
jgi:hypothetical protein